MTTETIEPSVIRTEEGGVATLMLSNPRRRNAMTRAMWTDLTEAARDLATRPDIRAVVIRGEGTVAFASGADISEFGESRRSADQADAYHEAVQGALDAIGAIPSPVIAQVHGYCVGAGTAIALACDLRYVDDNLKFGIPAAKLGIGYSPAWIRTLSQIVGPAVAAEILMSGQLFDAEKALRSGFANEVSPAAELDAFVAAKAATLAGNAPLTLQAAKISLRELSRPDQDRDWSAAYAAAQRCAESRDYQAALAAFAEKRTPDFTGE